MSFFLWITIVKLKMKSSKLKVTVQNSKLFFSSFLKNPRVTGSIVQSSQILAEKMLEKIDFQKANCIVELGGGAGIITKKILKKMPQNCALLCFEINEVLVKKLENIKDPRLVVINDSAEKIDVYLKKYGFQKADCIVSGLPLASLPPRTSRNILKNIYTYLPTGGQYIQFQYSLISLRQIKYLFSSVAISFVFLNFPPAFVYVCVKV
jgi:phospholipid N-methyltransferase